jgi:hypothetical protein
MAIENQETQAVDEKIWNAWLQKTKIRERQTTQRMKISAGVVLSLAAIAGGVILRTK